MARPAMLTVEEVAAQLGMKVSTIRLWVLERRIEYCKPGGKSVRIPQIEVDRIIEQSRVARRKSASAA